MAKTTATMVLIPVAFLCMTVIYCVSEMKPQYARAADNQAASGVPRYTLAGTSHAMYIIDQQTGKMWCYSDNGTLYLTTKLEGK